jgi:heme exporter protein CcmD
MSEFFAMGGYALYVWSCYGASALVLGLLVYFSLSAHSRARVEMADLEKQLGRREG